MTPDTPTLFLVGAVVCGLMAGFQLLVSLRLHNPPLGLWAGANLAACTGCTALAARPTFPIVGLLCGNGLLVLYMGLIVVGIDVFERKRPHVGELLAGPVIAVAGLALSVFHGDNIGERAIIVSSAVAYYAVRASLSLPRSPHDRATATRFACSAILLTFVFFYLARSIGISAGLLSPVGATSGLNGGLIRILAIGMAVTWGFGSLFLVLDQEASVDDLTGLLNRRAMIAGGAGAVREAAAGNRPLSVLMIDLDHFKKINDQFGHQAGDTVLQAFARLATQTVRTNDMVGRLGGEEFCIALPGSTAQQAMKVAERLRACCEESLGQALGEPLAVTVSTGIATLTPGNADFLRLVKAADQALYEAKAQGRNRIACARSADDRAGTGSPPTSPEPPQPRRIFSR